MAKQKLVVIGNGMAGARAVEEILKRGGGDMFDIVMFGDEPYGNYNRILLSNILNGTQTPDEITMNTLPWYRENNIRLHAGQRVDRIDRAAKLVISEGGVREHYDKLLIATGSRAFIPPMKGVRGEDGRLKPGVFGYRSLDDCAGIVEYAKKSKVAVTIGGGLLGLEAARSMGVLGCESHVVHLAGHLMEMQLDVTGGEILRDAIEGMGIAVHTAKMTTEVLGEEKVTGLRFKDGTELGCDLVIVAAGIRPNSELAMRAGFTVERAIVVNDHMQSVDDMSVYVVGECAQHRGKLYGLVAPLWEQAKVFADHITQADTKAAYHGTKLATKLKVTGVDLASMGITEPSHEDDEVVQFKERKRGTYKKLIVRNGRLVGGILMGDLSKAAFLMQAFERDAPLPEERLELLFDIGTPSAKVTFDEMPAEMQICNCNGITKATIAAAVEEGKRTPKAVMDATRAGMGCGACKGQINELVAWLCGGEVEDDPSVHYYVPTIPLRKPELAKEIVAHGLKSVSSVWRHFGGEDPSWKPALASLLITIWKGEYDDERDARFINDRVHANIQKDGTFSVVPEMAGGVCSPEELIRIGEVAKKWKVPLVKLTGGQRIDLVGLKKEDLPGIWSDLGFKAGYAWGKSYRTCKSCIGIDYCRFGLGDSMGFANRIEKRYRGIDAPAKLKLATAGCPRNCSEAYVKDVGFVAIGGGKWEIYVGGAAGAHIRKGDLLCTADSEEEAMTIGSRFMQFYRENAKWKERTYTFVPRVGLERLKAVIVEDAEGICERLDVAMQQSIDACVDPWLEAVKPKTANQFTSVVPVKEEV